MARKDQYPQDVLWTQRDRSSIRLGDMTDSHLANAVRLCRRNADRYDREAIAGYSYGGNPDSMGSYYAEQAAGQASDNMVYWSGVAETLTDELRRRYPNEQIVVRSHEQRLPRRSL